MRTLIAILSLCLVAAAQGSIALREAGAWTATSAASVTPVIPASQDTGDMMICIATGKPFDLSWSFPAAGWASLGTASSGTTAAGVDTGSMKVEVWYKVAQTSTESNPPVNESGNTFNVVQAAVCVFSKGAGEVWSTPVVTFGADETTGTAISVTFDADPGGVAGDYVMYACGINTDAMGPIVGGALSVTWTGITFGTADAIVEGEGTTGGDMASAYRTRPVSSGTSSAAPVMTGTGAGTGGADRLEGVFIRLRATTPSTSIKNVMGLDYASVKTVNDLAKASVKSIMDLP